MMKPESQFSSPQTSDPYRAVDTTADAIDTMISELRYTQEKLDNRIYKLNLSRINIFRPKEWVTLIVTFSFMSLVTGILISPVFLRGPNMITNVLDSVQYHTKDWGKF